jgi:hypothetical protein
VCPLTAFDWLLRANCCRRLIFGSHKKFTSVHFFRTGSIEFETLIFLFQGVRQMKAKIGCALLLCLMGYRAGAMAGGNVA